MKLDLKKINPFSKTADQKRDEAGKFTAGSGGLTKLQKLNWKRSLPVVVIVALVGGFLVFRSFAGQTLYKYQYSAYQCPGFNKADAAKNTSDSCVGASAEALTFRYYQGVFGRSPDAGGFKFWVQQLAGDRERVSRVAEKMLATREASYDKLSNADYVSAAYKNILGRNADPSGQAYWLGQLDGKKKTRDELLRNFAAQAKITPELAAQKMGKPTNEEFVKQAYVGLMGRPADAGGLAYWKGQLDTKKLAPKDVVARLAIENESIKKHAPAVAAYLADPTTAKVEVIPTAVKKQEANLYSAAVKANEARDQYNQISGLVDAGRKARDAAKAQADKNPPTRAHLSAIAANQKTVQGYKSRVPGPAKKIATINSQSKAFCTDAADIAAYSPDISDAKVVEQCNKTKLYEAMAGNITKDLDNLIGQIAASYKTAEGKYEAEQRRLAEEAARRAAEEAARRAEGGGGGGGGGGQLNPDACSTPANQIRSGMGADCTAKFQAAYGLSVDGVWGPATTAKYNQVHSNPGGPAAPPLTDYQIKDRMCRSLYGVGYSAVLGRCNTPSGSGSGGPSKPKRGKAPWSHCDRLSNTNPYPVTCFDDYKGYNKNSSGTYYTDLKRCTKQFGTLRSCSWYGWNGTSFVKGY